MALSDCGGSGDLRVKGERHEQRGRVQALGARELLRGWDAHADCVTADS